MYGSSGNPNPSLSLTLSTHYILRVPPHYDHGDNCSLREQSIPIQLDCVIITITITQDKLVNYGINVTSVKNRCHKVRTGHDDEFVMELVVVSVRLDERFGG